MVNFFKLENNRHFSMENENKFHTGSAGLGSVQSGGPERRPGAATRSGDPERQPGAAARSGNLEQRPGVGAWSGTLERHPGAVAQSGSSRMIAQRTLSKKAL